MGVLLRTISATTSVLALSFLTAIAGPMPPEQFSRVGTGGRDKAIIFHDNFDPPIPGWTTADYSWKAPKFHSDSHFSDFIDDPCYDGESWWCGEFNSGYSGGEGYGNLWIQHLLYQDVDVSGHDIGSDILVLTFHGRYDCEAGFDFTYVQAYNPATTEWDTLNAGYNGNSGGWFDVGMYGFVLEGDPGGGYRNYITADSTVTFKFLFESDGGYSDEDGIYDSEGGAFHVDRIVVFSFTTGKEYLHECDQSVGVPGPEPKIAGDYWHLSQRRCVTWMSPPYSYVCDDFPDTTSLPGGLDCWLTSPTIDITGANHCTVRFWASMHFDYDGATGTWWGASYEKRFSLDGGDSWFVYDTHIGDNERHFGRNRCTSGGLGTCCGWFYMNIDDWLGTVPGRLLKFAIAVRTDPDGATGCAASNSCWWAMLEAEVETRGQLVGLEEMSTGWGEIKSMFR
jgi:hypothetical protein